MSLRRQTKVSRFVFFVMISAMLMVTLIFVTIISFPFGFCGVPHLSRNHQYFVAMCLVQGEKRFVFATQRIVCPWKLPCTQSTRSLQGRVLPCTRIKILSLKNIALYPYFVPKSLIFRSFSHSSIFSVSIWLISTIYFVIYIFCPIRIDNK